jgi:hypothetical protein
MLQRTWLHFKVCSGITILGRPMSKSGFQHFYQPKEGRLIRLCQAAMACVLILLFAPPCLAQSTALDQKPDNMVGEKINRAKKLLESKGFKVVTVPYPTRFPSKHHKVFIQRKIKSKKQGLLGSRPQFGQKAKQSIELWYYDMNTSHKRTLPKTAKKTAQKEPVRPSQEKSLEDELVMVPNVIGLSKLRARILLKSSGLTLYADKTETTNDPTKDGLVSAQIPESPEMALKGTIIRVTMHVYEPTNPIIENLKKDAMAGRPLGDGMKPNEPEAESKYGQKKESKGGDGKKGKKDKKKTSRY